MSGASTSKLPLALATAAAILIGGCADRHGAEAPENPASGFAPKASASADADHADAGPKPWAGGYADVTVAPAYLFETLSDASHLNVVLAFVLAPSFDTDSPCTPTWAGRFTLDEAARDLRLDDRIAALRALGHEPVISFGGSGGGGPALGIACTDSGQLAEAYATTIDRYQVSTIDLDIEDDALADAAARRRRVAAIEQVQRDRPELDVWLTLAADADGLPDEAMTAIREYFDAGVRLAGVNVMIMNYQQRTAHDGESVTSGELGVKALAAAHQQLTTARHEAGLEADASTVWRHLGATPMIGQNEWPGEVFTLDDARTINAFAQVHGMGRVSLWSLNRDQECNLRAVDEGAASTFCSGVEQQPFAFAHTLFEGFTGSVR